MHTSARRRSRQVKRPEDMPVFEALYHLALDVERLTRSFGRVFQWLRSQVNRAAEATPANIAEGFYAQYSTEYLHSLYRARREAREATVHLRYAADVGAGDPSTTQRLLVRYEEALRQLNAVIAAVERKIEKSGKARAK